MGSIEYHLRELEIALNPNDDRRILPNILDSDETILDIGCGVGQAFIALNCTNRICIGIDIDQDAIAYGMKNYGDKIQFICADANRVPMPSNTFNLVFSRVALPYTNIPKVIKEIKRVLKNDGRVWLTLHDKTMANKYLKEAINSRLNIKRLVYVVYILLNGYSLKYFGIIFPFITGRYESWQDNSAMKKLLLRNGFEANYYRVGKHTVVEGFLRDM